MEEEPLKQPTLNKNGKPRKQLGPEALERLAKAREKANAIRAQNSAKKLEQRANEKNDKAKDVLEKEELKEKELKEKELENELKEETEVVEIVKEKLKPKPKKKTKIIVEQSSEDSDEFEPNDNVVFVKRVSRKKKEPVRPPTPPPQPPPEPQPQPQPPPLAPKLTPQQIQNQRNYEAMATGAFLNNSLMRRYY